MKKFIEFLNHPLIHLVIGLAMILWIVCAATSLGDDYDLLSGFYGALFVVALDIWDYGVHFFYRKRNK